MLPLPELPSSKHSPVGVCIKYAHLLPRTSSAMAVEQSPRVSALDPFQLRTIHPMTRYQCQLSAPSFLSRSLIHRLATKTSQTLNESSQTNNEKPSSINMSCASSSISVISDNARPGVVSRVFIYCMLREGFSVISLHSSVSRSPRLEVL